jgi:hypothetical protein
VQPGDQPRRPPAGTTAAAKQSAQRPPWGTGPLLFLSIASDHDHVVQNANGEWENSTVQGTMFTSDGV